MKTRSNMPLFVVECENVKALSNSQIDLLRCGDYLVKKDASGEHAYKVTFKSDTGMCITYHDAYCVETQSYDKIDGVWTYNSEDKTIIAEPLMENIVDGSGHHRFLEGEIKFNEITGLSQSYGKWSLSGSHLLLVIAGGIANGTALSGTIANVNLPDWIKNKLVTIYGQAVIRQTDNVYSSDGSTNQSVINVLGKSGTNIYLGSYITANADRYFRFQFDLLIDNE